MADDIYAFSKESDLDRIAQSVQKTESRIITGGGMDGNEDTIYFAEITSIVADTDSKQAKGKQVLFDASTGDYTDAENWIFDDDNETVNKQGDLYSAIAMAVGDVVEVKKHTDSSDTTDFVAIPIGAGAQRPIIQTAGVLTYGATLESIISKAVDTEFTEAQEFKAIMPWGDAVDLPADYIFTADVDSSGAYYTEAYSTSMFAIPSGAYPAATGYTSFKIYDSADTGGTVLYDSSGPGTYKLLLDSFDFANAETPAKSYYSGLPFPASFDVSQKAFYFISPLVN